MVNAVISEEDVLKRRLGTFYVSEPIAMTGEIGKIFHMLGFVPVAMNYNWATEIFEYMGCSPQFAILPKGSAIPRYQIYVHTKTDDEGKQVIERVSVGEYYARAGESILDSGTWEAPAGKPSDEGGSEPRGGGERNT